MAAVPVRRSAISAPARGFGGPQARPHRLPRSGVPHDDRFLALRGARRRSTACRQPRTLGLEGLAPASGGSLPHAPACPGSPCRISPREVHNTTRSGDEALATRRSDRADRAVDHRERYRMMARTKRSRRSYSAGEWGRNRVRVFPDPKTGLIQIEWREDGRRLTRSLGHRDWTRAKRQADEGAAGWAGTNLADEVQAEPTPLTLEALFDIYGEEVTPTKSDPSQTYDRAAMKMFLWQGPEARDALPARLGWVHPSEAGGQGRPDLQSEWGAKGRRLLDLHDQGPSLGSYSDRPPSPLSDLS